MNKQGPTQEESVFFIKELDIEVETKIHDKGAKLVDINIPHGWRLLRIHEIIFLHNNEEYRKKLNMDDTWEFIEQPLKLNKTKGYVTRFYSSPMGSGIDCYGLPQGSVYSLGVRFCKDSPKHEK